LSIISRPNSSPFLKGCEELTHALNWYPLEAAESQQVLVAAHDDLCVRGDSALQNAIVRCAVELVSQDAEGFFEDGFGNPDVDVTVDCQVKKLFSAPELDGADEDVRICNDSPHERARVS
jgi:hypothetical protein